MHVGCGTCTIVCMHGCMACKRVVEAHMHVLHCTVLYSHGPHVALWHSALLALHCPILWLWDCMHKQVVRVHMRVLHCSASSHAVHLTAVGTWEIGRVARHFLDIQVQGA